jgi:hypothetical protein
VPTGVWTSGAGKAREPGGGIHRDGGPMSAGGGAEGVERTPSKGAGPGSGLKVPRIMSAPSPAPAPNMPTENAGLHDLADGVKALVFDEQS